MNPAQLINLGELMGQRTCKIDPLLPFTVGAWCGRNARVGGLSVALPTGWAGS